MPIHIITTRNEGFSWHSHDGLHVKGYLFDSSETLRRNDTLADYFSAITEADHFTTRLGEANGSFAIILETDRALFAAVDPVRSIPLFYAIEGDDLLIGDDLSVIQDQLGGSVIDPLAREEFLRFGYTVGARTLDPRIKQIEAGEAFVFDISTAQISTSTYFSHAHGNYTDKSEETLIEELDHITSRWTQRLIESVQGRTIVVPLSGGYDSRYIVCALKRANYLNVICYSYGVPDSYEHKIAQKVATQLGFPFHIIDYSSRSWKPLLESSRFREFCQYAFQQSAVPCIQELLARDTLLKDHAIPDDSIFVPGYCGDLQGGSFVPQEVLNRKAKRVLAEGIDQYILRDRFTLRTSPASLDIEQAVLAEIHQYTSRFKTDDIQDFCSVLEDWVTRNQVAKFVLNTLRTHELYGNEWRLPLWDSELIQWWYQIPLVHRMNSVLFHKFLFERMFAPAEVAFGKPRKRGQLNRLAQRWLPEGLIPLMRTIYKQTLKRTLSRRHVKPVDIDGFEVASAFLLEQLPPDLSAGDFRNINGVVGTWCLMHNL